MYFAAAGSSTPIVAVGQNFRHEPASSIKVLYLLYALQRVQAGTDSLSSPFTWYPSPSDPNKPGVCPDPSWEVPGNAQTTTLQDGLNRMMQNSDNRMTRGMAIRYGLAPVNAMASSLGMSNAQPRQPFIGCGFNGGVRNDLTTADAGKLYSAVQHATALSPKYRKIFFNIEVGGAPSPSSYLGQVVSQEAAALGKSGDVAAFLAAMDVRWKAGSYVFCLSSTCAQFRDDYSIDGRMTISYKKASGNTYLRQFVFGDFVNDLVCTTGTNCNQAAGNMISGADAEAARSTIRAALKTWP